MDGGGDPSNTPGLESKTALGSADDTAGNSNRQLLGQIIAARTEARRREMFLGGRSEQVARHLRSGTKQNHQANSQYWTQDSGNEPDVQSGYGSLGARLVKKRRLLTLGGKVVRDINRWGRGGRRKR